jgi:hypothetical protein
VHALSIVEAFDPIDDVQPRLLARVVLVLIHAFDFKRLKKLSIAALS